MISSCIKEHSTHLVIVASLYKLPSLFCSTCSATTQFVGLSMPSGHLGTLFGCVLSPFSQLS